MLRRLAFAILLLLAPGMTWAQGLCYLCYTPPSSAGGGTWGSITGTLSAQTDLNDALTVRPTITASASYPSGACTPGNLWRVTGVNYLFQCGPNAIWDYSRRNTTGNVFYFHGAWTDSTNNEGMSITATPGQDTQFQNFTDGTGTDNIGFNFIPAGTGTFKVGTTLFVVGSTAVTSTVPLLIPAGTAASPTLVFGTTTPGIYGVDVATIGISTGGTVRFQFSGNSGTVFNSNDTGSYRLGAASDLIFTRDGAANFQLGVDAATATAQTISAADSTGAGIAGASLTLSGGVGGAGGLQGNVIIDAGSNLVVSPSIQGSKSKALTDDTATAFATMAMPQTAGSNYGGGKIIYTIFCKDASNQATQSGTVTFACHNLAGAEACGFGTPDGVTLGDGTASLGTPVFTAAAGADLVTISVQSDCAGITPTTHTIESRADLPHPNTWTPIP